MNAPDKTAAISDGIQISVIIPAYNSEKYISRCLESICNQTINVSYEIIVINDGSADQTSDVATLFSARHKNVLLINTGNGGVSRARNNGLRAAGGRYVTFLDADDYVSEDYLATLYAMAQLGHDLVVSDAIDVTEDGHEILRKNQYTRKKLDISIRPNLHLMSPAVHSTAWGCLYEKEIIGEIEFDENLTVGEDTVFFFQCLSVAKRAVYIPYQGYYYVQRQQSAVHSSSLIRYWHESMAWSYVSDLMPSQSRAASEAKAISVYHAARGVLYEHNCYTQCCGVGINKLYDCVNKRTLSSIGRYLINGKPRSAATILFARLASIAKRTSGSDNQIGQG